MYPFSNLANFRDLGGIPGFEGKRIKDKRLLRSGELYQLGQEDIALLQEHQLRYIFDLRSFEELEGRPDDTIPGARLIHANVTKDTAGNTSSENLFKQKDLDLLDSYMKKGYYDLMVNPAAIKEFRRMFEYLLEMEEGSALFHCFAGKDRTGVTVAVVLTALGASKEAIFGDYLMTNKLREQSNKRLYAQISKDIEQDIAIEAFNILMNVKKEYLAYSYETAKSMYGSFEAFVTDIIGLTPAETKRLHALYLI